MEKYQINILYDSRIMWMEPPANNEVRAKRKDVELKVNDYANHFIGAIEKIVQIEACRQVKLHGLDGD